MSQNQSKFDLWWNAPTTKRIVGAAYSLGAAVVIIGAMFKILHLEGAGLMLGIGMTVEAVLFALGVFDKPHQDYEWHKVFDFESEGTVNIAGGTTSVPKANVGAVQTKTVSGPKVDYSAAISDDDVKKLSE